MSKRNLPAPLRIDYEPLSPAEALADPYVLAVCGFGKAAPAAMNDPRYLRVDLEPAQTPAPFEIWRTPNIVRSGQDGVVNFASDGDYLFGSIEIQEIAPETFADTVEKSYGALCSFMAASAVPHILRIWNYFTAINQGEGDAERYKQFCIGRAAGMGGFFNTGFPAATTIGRQGGNPTFQMYWLASAMPGLPLENPRQVKAYQYPRQYGPVAPSFVRAMRSSSYPGQTHISGTAAVVGHASHHIEDVTAQLDEIFHNLSSLISVTDCTNPARAFGSTSALKVYVRKHEHLAIVHAYLRDLPCPYLILQGDVCRKELLVEIDGFHS